MSVIVRDLEPAVDSEPIPGYILKRRIACGGFGEVWEAQAPGGLAKAVKFVYGSLDEALASQELASLRRIREVHHPFLLSLERIEVVEGRLLIVSELADGCLMDRFQAAREQGLPGIPREELLGYLQDAAEVLDYLYERHSLQHLDVKPQNLLLVGNRVKVADFGLLRNLHDGETAKIGGISPMYAPPELLSGNPCRHSDQYSLAVVYQEMLTGEPPFQGRNTAQLAAQHLYSLPAISPLPSTDQPVISRALAKTPEARFNNCRDFIKSLRAPDNTTVLVAHRSPASSVEAVVDKTVVLDSNTPPGTTAQEWMLENVSITHQAAEPITVEDTSPAPRPTLFIGIGGMANRVLTDLRAQLAESFGKNLSEIPAIQMLRLDTDAKPLAESLLSGPAHSVPARETLAIPLRQATEYRAESERFLSWLNRRWLFNIPRSLRTESMRPYGRLAFVDHQSSIRERLKRLIREAFSPEAAIASTNATGRAFHDPVPRIFLVACISGGTGSGVVLDLAYLVRSILQELQMPDEGVTGILIHGHSRQSGHRELAIANACACLSELRQFSQPGGRFLPDPSSGTADFAQKNETFHQTYFVDLGEELSESETAGKVREIADYLALNVLPPTSHFFDAIRETERAESGNGLRDRRVRSFGVARIPLDVTNARPSAATLSAILSHWIDPEAPSAKHQSSQVTAAALEMALDIGIGADQLQESIGNAAQARLRHSATPLARRVIAELRTRLADQPIGAVVSTFDNWLAMPTTRSGSTQSETADQDESLANCYSTVMHELVQKLGPAIRDWILAFTEVPGARLSSARLAAKAISAILEKSYTQARSQVERLQVEANNTKRRLFTDSPAASTQRLDSELSKYAETRARQALLRATQTAAATLIRSVHAATQQIQKYTACVQRTQELIRSNNRNSPPHSRTSVGANTKLPFDFLQQIDQHVGLQLTAARGTLRDLLSNTKSAPAIVELLESAAQFAALARNAQQQSHSSTIQKAWEEQVEAAVPRAYRHGGTSHLLVSAPQGFAELDHLTRRANVVTRSASELTFCHEMQQIPLDSILRDLLGRFPNCIDAVRRCHTRNDIEWLI